MTEPFIWQPEPERVMDAAPDISLQRERALLFVDDEKNVLSSLVRACRQDEYNIFTATSGPEGLEVLKEHEIHVVVSDQRMADMSGTEFLKEVKNRFPNTVRIVLSGYTELETVTRAINEGAIYKFIEKPWEVDVLRKAIGEAFRHFEVIDKNKKLAMKLKDVNKMLAHANDELKFHLELQKNQTEMNIQVMKNTRDTLELLPVELIGIDEAAMIAVVNAEARRLFGVNQGIHVGQSIKNAANGALFSAYQKIKDSNEVLKETIELEGIGCLEIAGRQRILENGAKGVMMVITHHSASTGK